MPTLSEFVLTIGLRRNPSNGERETFCRFETLHQFRSFQYEVEVESLIDTEQRVLDFKIKGVAASAHLMSSSGPGVNEVVCPELHGEYTVQVSGAQESGSFRFRGDGTGIELIDVDNMKSMKVHVANKIEMI